MNLLEVVQGEGLGLGQMPLKRTLLPLHRIVVRWRLSNLSIHHAFPHGRSALERQRLLPELQRRVQPCLARSYDLAVLAVHGWGRKEQSHGFKKDAAASGTASCSLNLR